MGQDGAGDLGQGIGLGQVYEADSQRVVAQQVVEFGRRLHRDTGGSKLVAGSQCLSRHSACREIHG
jgi:hypothetical protein